MKAPTLLATLLLLSVPFALPQAAASGGAAVVCSSLGTGACAGAALSHQILSCVDLGASWRCTIAWTLRLDVMGPTCGWAWSEATGELLVCNPLPGTVMSATSPGVAAYDLPHGGGSIMVDGAVCVDYATPVQQCAPLQMSLWLNPS